MVYGQDFPPEYDIQKTSVPTALMGGQNDLLAKTEDIQWIEENLEKIGKLAFYKIYPIGHVSFFAPAKKFTHLDDTVRQLQKYTTDENEDYDQRTQ